MQMLTQTPETMVHPGLADSAYRGVVRRTTSARSIEYHVFAEVTLALEQADAPDAEFAARVSALQRNRALWWNLACDAAGDNNALPVDMRASILGLALWVDRESSRALRQSVPLGDLVEINRTVMAGLQPHPEPP